MIDRTTQDLYGQIAKLRREMERRRVEVGPATPNPNILFNSDGRINQRGTNNSYTSGSGVYLTDGWRYVTTGANGCIAAMAGTSPSPAQAGAHIAIPMQIYHNTAGAFNAATSYEFVDHLIEAYDFDAAQGNYLSLSWWCWSSYTGIFGATLLDAPSGRAFPIPFQVTLAATWQKFSAQIPPDPSGGYGSGTGIGAQLRFTPMCGTNFQAPPNVWSSGNFVGPNTMTSTALITGGAWHIAAPKLEVGPVATPYTVEPFLIDAARCLRRLWVVNGPLDNSQSGAAGYPFTPFTGQTNSTTTFTVVANTPVPMRVNPSSLQMIGNWAFWPAVGAYGISAPSIANYSTTAIRIDGNLTAVAPSANIPGFIQGSNDVNGRLVISAEF